ncbi:MAG: 1-(5-phosphoribosyl)-5-[(5-phosphoribosylamino)methylideneamino]imidazole-4-carboxamide isomerase [Pseudomonadota bacterium]
MQIYPAIDLRGGNCVRLRKGDFSQETIFHTDPAAQAVIFQNQGATWLHLVDLDGARGSVQENGKAITAIRDAYSGAIQLGGGIRSLDDIARVFDHGIDRVILGTAAIEDPDFARTACQKYPKKIAIGLDARGQALAIAGWEKDTTLTLQAAFQKFHWPELAAIIYTDIHVDGTGQGAQIARTAELARTTNVPVIASGGVASTADIVTARATGVISGIICGRALYDGGLDLGEALAQAAKDKGA